MASTRGPLRLHLVRHGRTSWNDAGLAQGATAGVPLTAEGHRQAAAAAAALAGCGATVLLTSDLRRAVETATPIGRALGLVPRPTPDLRERSLGTLEGRPSAEVWAELDALDPPVDWTDPDLRVGGGESVREVHDRVGNLLGALLADPPDGGAVLVGHADCLRVALAWLAGRPASDVPWVDLAPGSVTVVEAGRVPA